MQWVRVQAGIGELRVLPNLPRSTLPPRVEASLYGYCRSEEVNSKCIRGVQDGIEMET